MFALFLPKPSLELKPIVPAFMVNVVEISSGEKAPIKQRPAKNEQVVIKKSRPSIKKSKTLLKQNKKSLVVKKAVQKQSKPKTNKIINALKDLDKKTAAVAPLHAKKMFEELDQLAKLEQSKKPIAKPKNKKNNLEETFRELKKLKDKKIQIAKKKVPKPVIKNLLEDFDDLKMEEVVEEKRKEKQQPVKKNIVEDIDNLKIAKAFEQKELEKQKPVIKNLLENFDDLKMEELVEQKKVEKKPDPVKKKIDGEKTSVVEKRNLLNELENLAKLDSTNKKDEKESVEKVIAEEKVNKVYESVLKKLESISVVSSRVAVEIADPKLDKSKYQSKLRTLSDTPRKTEIPSDDNSFVFSEREGTPDADVQSLYALLIREKIYKNWRDPLAEQHSKEAIISFHIFPKGNIDKPFIKQSSGVEVLDTLAVRAVLDSVPFPQFPKELKKSNLLLSIYFKYVPKDQ
ncbi:MAG: TonB C-terminal domain-containing protein [Nitrospinota bacterium]|nr:TonB C-terminal domain-containing protein [Nitrospinota bacterium]